MTDRCKARAPQSTDPSDRTFSELAALTLGALGWEHVEDLGNGTWSVKKNVLSGDTSEMHIALINDGAPRPGGGGPGRRLGREVLFDGAALGHYLGSEASETPTGQVTLRTQRRRAQVVAPKNLKTIDRLLIESPPGEERRRLLQWLDSWLRKRSRSQRDTAVLCVPLLFRAADVPEGRLLQEVVLSMERNLLFRHSQLVVPLIRAGYVALLIDGIEAWSDGGRLDPNHGSLGSFLRLVGPSGRFILTCDRRQVIHESAPPDFHPDYLLPVGKRFFLNPSLRLASYDPPENTQDSPRIQQAVESWLGGSNRSGFFGRHERSQLLDKIVRETVSLQGGALPTSVARRLALDVLPEGWRLIPNADEALDTLRNQRFCKYDRATGFRFRFDGDHEELLVDWMVRQFIVNNLADIESILGLPDIPARVLRLFVQRLGDQLDRFYLTLCRYLAAGEPKVEVRANAIANGLKALTQLREEFGDIRQFLLWPEGVSLKGASNLARLLLGGRPGRLLHLKNWDFSACNLFQASFFHVHFTKCHFDSAYLAACQFVNCVLEDCSLRGADLTGSRLVDLDFRGSNHLMDATFWSSVFEYSKGKDNLQPTRETLRDADTRNTKGLSVVDADDSTDLPGLRQAVAELESIDTLYPSHRFAVSWQRGLEFRRLSATGCKHRYVVPDVRSPEQVQAHDDNGHLLVAARWASQVCLYRWDGTDTPPVITRPQVEAAAMGLSPTGELALAMDGRLHLFEPGIEEPDEQEVLGTVVCVQPVLLASSVEPRRGWIVGTKDGRVELDPDLVEGQIRGTVGFGAPVSITQFDAGRFVVIWADNAIEIVDPRAEEFSVLRVNTAFKYVHRVTTDPRRQSALIVGRYTEPSESVEVGTTDGGSTVSRGVVGCALLDLKWGQLLEYWEPERSNHAELDAWVGSVQGASVSTTVDAALSLDEFSRGIVIWQAATVREMLGLENLRIWLTPTAIVAGKPSEICLRLVSAVPLHMEYKDRGTADERRQLLRLSVTMVLAGKRTGRRIDIMNFQSEDRAENSGEVQLVCEVEPLEEDDYIVDVAVSLAGVRHVRRLPDPIQVWARNPYHGSGTAILAGSNRFFGREDLLKRAIQRLESQCVGIRGSWHSGKTSFLNELMTRLVSRIDDPAVIPLIPAFVNLENVITSLTSATVLTQALADMKTRYPQYYPSLSADLHDAVEKEMNWAELMNHELARVFRPGARFVLVLDEFGYVWKSSQLQGALHGLSNQIRIVATGLPLHFKRPPHDLSGSGVETIFSNPISLGPLTDPEARQVVTQPLGTYWSIEPDAIDEAIRRSSRMPHDLQALMQGALDLADVDDTQRISVDHIRRAFEPVVEQYDRFDVAWKRLNPEARAGLVSMMAGLESLFVARGNFDFDVEPLFEVGLADYEASVGESLYLPSGFVANIRRKGLIL
jgi:hypothetical protein